MTKNKSWNGFLRCFGHLFGARRSIKSLSLRMVSVPPPLPIPHSELCAILPLAKKKGKQISANSIILHHSQWGRGGGIQFKVFTKSAHIEVSTKKCPQKVSIKMSTKVSTKSVHKKCPQNVFTKCVHQMCPQNVSTKYVHKKCPQ